MYLCIIVCMCIYICAHNNIYVICKDVANLIIYFVLSLFFNTLALFY